MSNFITALERDLQAVIHRHNHITGREFQAACLRMAHGYYDPDDLDPYHQPEGLAQAIARELERLGP